MRIIFGVFLAAHGLVHALYAAHSLRLLEIKPGFAWPDGSWSLSWLGDPTVRLLVAVAFMLLAATFAVSGIALVFSQAWWQPLAVFASASSITLLLLLWNGRLQALDAQGVYAICINAGILVAVIVFHWPQLSRA